MERGRETAVLHQGRQAGWETASCGGVRGTGWIMRGKEEGSIWSKMLAMAQGDGWVSPWWKPGATLELFRVRNEAASAYA